nr:unnamed protein product [Callosobruchus analis]
MSQNLCDKLGLRKQKIDFNISGIAQSDTRVQYKTVAKILSKFNGFKIALSCLVLPTITGIVPATSFNANLLNLPNDIKLADPNFNKANQIDLLIGADLFWDLLCIGQIKLGRNRPILQKTKLGWIISGPLLQNTPQSGTCNLSLSTLENALTKFWELEEIQNKKFTSHEEEVCERHFTETVSQHADGHFIVSIPLKQPESMLGESKALAKRRFLNLEQKLKKHPILKAEYHEFIQEYIDLGHMTICQDQRDGGFFMPHHCVVKEHSITTKLRVVFDGSAKSTSGYSVNDLMMVGPTIQNDLFSILIRFRKHNVVLGADITKMYRQVWVRKEQRHLQKILWRFDPSLDIDTFELNTVTYGTASAAFLAIRSLQEVAHIHQHTNPHVCKVIINDFYVDDLLTGCDTTDQAIKLKSELSDLLSGHGFILRKWTSNDVQIQNSSPASLQIGTDQPNKTLGILWTPTQDILQYSISQPDTSARVSKRQILSCIAQIFDPLGLLAPVTITSKLILQELWKLNISWDESIPSNLYTIWTNYRAEFVQLNAINFPRHVSCRSPVSIQLHGFSDASERAYGAVVYIRSLDTQGNCFVNILCAKTRVAPLKPITIPRLELCGALLLAQLMSKIKESMNIDFDNIFYWTDSQIVLCWLNTSPHTLKTFVANRSSQIQELSDSASWRYINTSDNPADLLSRGLSPSTLHNSVIWFHGPNWLSKPEQQWPSYRTQNISTHTVSDLPELKERGTTLLSVENHFLPIINKISSFPKLQRIFAYIIRFRNNLRSTNKQKYLGPLTPEELSIALISIIKVVQKSAFPDDYHSLSAKKCVGSKSKLLSLHPFIDSDGAIRVGGRIENSDFSYDKKHPYILPNDHHITKIIARNEHIRLSHAGPQSLLASIRERFWPISGKRLTRKIVRECITCFRFSLKQEHYLMGNLPKFRVTPARPFISVGIDFGGPFLIRDRKGRNFKTSKAYIALFVCLSTKAIHIEIVSDLTTDCFLAAFRRFTSRRGICSLVISDNGATFVGASRELKQFIHSNQNEIANNLASNQIKWSFIPLDHLILEEYGKQQLNQ